MVPSVPLDPVANMSQGGTSLLSTRRQARFLIHPTPKDTLNVPSKLNNEQIILEPYGKDLFEKDLTTFFSTDPYDPTCGQVLDRLVQPSLTPHDAYTCCLSTS